MNPFCNLCGGPLGGCGHCGHCQPDCGCKKKCPKPCGCPEQILSIEADTTRPAYLRFNLGGRSVWYDFTSVVKGAETCTTLKPDITSRTLVYDAECGRQTMSAPELGSILHLADIGDVDATTIKDNAILVYRKDADCGENCDGKNGWVGLDPSEEPDTDLDYIIGSDGEGRTKSLQPPVNTNQFNYMAWRAGDKAGWTQPTEVVTPPVDGDGYAYHLYLDPSTKAIVFHKVKVEE